MAVFVLFYYKQVLGLSGTLTGLAIAISIIWDGISDPLVGAWSDRLRSRIGRRHPLMIAAVIPMAAGFVMLYGPPNNVLGDQFQLFTWLLISILLVRTALTFFMVPYLALGAEIVDDYHERSQLAGMRTNIAWFICTLVSASALIFLFNRRKWLRRPLRHRQLPVYSAGSTASSSSYSAPSVSPAHGIAFPDSPAAQYMRVSMCCAMQSAHFRIRALEA